VTGATDGIGKCYAKQLAAKGLNIVLVSRSPKKLADTKYELESLEPSIEVKTIAVDFTDGRSIYEEMGSQLSDLDIGVLVNNVGMCLNFCQPFADIENEAAIDALIACNVVSVPRMIHLILPGMLRRKRGVIINLGSLSGAVATPLATLYGASKAFVNKFSDDLEYELRGSGVIVQTVVPAYVMTNMVKANTRVQSSFYVPNADQYVTANLRTLGLESSTSSFWAHKIEIAFYRFFDYMAPEISMFCAYRSLTYRRRRGDN